MNKFFDIPLGDDPAKTSPDGSFVSKYLLAHYQRIDAIEKEIKRLPTQEEFFFLQSNKQFNAFTFIPLISKFKTIKKLYATTYSINRNVIEALVELHKSGIIDSMELVVNDSILSRNPVVCDLLRSVNQEYANIQVRFAWTHAKVCLAETKEDNFIIEGSGNWSENAMYEQYTFANSKSLFDFRKKLITEIDVRHEIDKGELISYRKTRR